MLYNNAGKAVAKVDLYTAGFPCQPYSLAGKRKGPRDERDLSSVISIAIGCRSVSRGALSWSKWLDSAVVATRLGWLAGFPLDSFGQAHFEKFMKKLRGANYSVGVYVLCSRDFGLPQAPLVKVT